MKSNRRKNSCCFFCFRLIRECLLCLRCFWRLQLRDGESEVPGYRAGRIPAGTAFSQSGTATGSSTPERRSRKPERPPSGARTSSCDLNDPYSLVRPLNEMNVTRRAANRIQAGRSLRRGLCVCSPRQARTYQASEVPGVGPTSGLKDRAS